jgi:hypothetical protein
MFSIKDENHSTDEMTREMRFEARVITQVEYQVEIRRKPSSFDEGCNAASIGVFELVKTALPF